MLAKFNPSRLRLARTRRQLTLKALADKIGLSSRMVSEYEKDYCKAIPPEDTVDAFSKALGYPRDFFLDSECVETIHRDSVSFRSLKSMKAADEHAAIAAGQIGIMISEYFDRNFNLITPQLPNLRGLEPEVAADALRQEWGLGNLSIGNMIHTLEKRGIRIFSLAENTHEVDAFSFWKGSVPYIFLNTQKSSERSRFDAAHELGHLVLHKHGIPQGRDIEAEADRFASFFLMPRVTILPYKGKSITIDSVLSMKKNWKVSAMSLIVQMRNIGILSEWQYKTLIITASKLGLRTTEIDSIPRERSLIIDKLLTALEQEGKPLSIIAQDLKLPLDEITGLLFSFGVVKSPDSVSLMHNTHKNRPNLQLVKS